MEGGGVTDGSLGFADHLSSPRVVPPGLVECRPHGGMGPAATVLAAMVLVVGVVSPLGSPRSKDKV